MNNKKYIFCLNIGKGARNREWKKYLKKREREF